jgi:hypothetical protein
VASTAAKGSPAPSARSGSLFGRLFGGGGAAAPSRGASSRGTSSAGAGRSGVRQQAAARGRPDQPVGYRAALTGLLASVAAIVATFLVHTPLDARGDFYTKPSIVGDWAQTALHAAQKAPSANGAALVKAIGDDWMPGRTSDRLFTALFPQSLAVLLPVVGAYLVFRSVQRRRGAKIVTRGMYATMLGAFLTLNLLQFFLPTVIATAVAGWQVRRSEMNEARAQMAADAASPQGDDVIDADVVDATVVEPDEVIDDDDVIDADVIEDAPTSPSTNTLLGRLRGGTSGAGDPDDD